MMPRSLLALTVVVAAAGCQDSALPGGCLAVINYAVDATITDSATGAPVAANAFGWVQEGNYRDVLAPSEMTMAGVVLARQAAEGRPGTYNVVIQVAGYSDFVATNVVAPAAHCGLVTTAHLAARMQPAP